MNFIDYVNVSEMTALMMAARYGRTDKVKVLLENGADMEATNINGTTALMFAAIYGRTEIVKMLLKHGADVESKNNTDSTALMFAAGGVLKGARLGMIACDYQGHTDIVEILEDEIERRKQLKMARYTFLRHTNFHLAQEIAVRINPKR